MAKPHKAPKEGWDSLLRDDLIEECTHRGMTGCSHMNKPELVKLLEEDDATVPSGAAGQTDLPLEEVEPKGAKPPKKAAVVREPVTGRLYSAEPGRVVLAKEDDPAIEPAILNDGTVYEMDEKPEVTMGENEATLDDLKRGDRVTLTGEPVSKIAAHRS